jgi:glycerophosphoryl diester phosphodiesterase
MTALLDLGVDGIITNRPDLLRAILSEYGYQLPEAYQRP